VAGSPRPAPSNRRCRWPAPPAPRAARTPPTTPSRSDRSWCAARSRSPDPRPAPSDRRCRFTGMTPAALWDDIRLGFSAMRHLTGYAVVTDLTWVRDMTTFSDAHGAYGVNAGRDIEVSFDHVGSAPRFVAGAAGPEPGGSTSRSVSTGCTLQTRRRADRDLRVRSAEPDVGTATGPPRRLDGRKGRPPIRTRDRADNGRVCSGGAARTEGGWLRHGPEGQKRRPVRTSSAVGPNSRPPDSTLTGGWSVGPGHPPGVVGLRAVAPQPPASSDSWMDGRAG
jgi:hypothetical protein